MSISDEIKHCCGEDVKGITFVPYDTRIDLIVGIMREEEHYRKMKELQSFVNKGQTMI